MPVLATPAIHRKFLIVINHNKVRNNVLSILTNAVDGTLTFYTFNRDLIDTSTFTILQATNGQLKFQI